MTDDTAPTPTPARGQISRIEWIAAALAVVVLAALVVAEPDILGAPVENSRTIALTVGGTLLAAIALAAMVRRRVPPVLRLLILGVPLVASAAWLISPFFRDHVVDEAFETSIAAAADATTTTTTATDPSTPTASVPPTAPAGPRLLGAGSFVGLAGHEGTGDAGFFELPDGSTVLRLERFDIENGPDLRLYVVPGGEQVRPAPGSTDLGQLRGNVGDQTYQLPGDLSLTAGDWTVLVWCEAFGVEFVAATVPLSS